MLSLQPADTMTDTPSYPTPPAASPEISPADPTWNELSPEERFLVLQKAAEENKSARLRAMSLPKPSQKKQG